MGCGEKPSRSLETKWGVIKHDVLKFCGAYKLMLSLNKKFLATLAVLQICVCSSLGMRRQPTKLQLPILYYKHCLQCPYAEPAFVMPKGQQSLEKMSIKKISLFMRVEEKELKI